MEKEIIRENLAKALDRLLTPESETTLENVQEPIEKIT